MPAKKSKPKPKAKKKVVLKVKIKPLKPIGRITHYFDHIKVAVIKLKAPLAKGNQIRIVGGQDTDFKQKVGSMQVNHKDLKRAKKGQSLGLKVSKKVREGYKVYKV